MLIIARWSEQIGTELCFWVLESEVPIVGDQIQYRKVRYCPIDMKRFALDVDLIWSELICASYRDLFEQVCLQRPYQEGSVLGGWSWVSSFWATSQGGLRRKLCAMNLEKATFHINLYSLYSSHNLCNLSRCRTLSWSPAPSLPSCTTCSTRTPSTWWRPRAYWSTQAEGGSLTRWGSTHGDREKLQCMYMKNRTSVEEVIWFSIF